MTEELSNGRGTSLGEEAKEQMIGVTHGTQGRRQNSTITMTKSVNCWKLRLYIALGGDVIILEPLIIIQRNPYFLDSKSQTIPIPFQD